MSDTQETMQRLILAMKGSRSYATLSRDCGGIPTTNRVQAMATKPMENFPNPETIMGLSHGLNVPVTRIVLACSRSLGLPVRDSFGEGELVLQGAGDLPAESKELLVSMGRQLVAAYGDTPNGRRVG